MSFKDISNLLLWQPTCLAQQKQFDKIRSGSLLWNYFAFGPGLEVIKLEYSLKLKIKRNDWLLADTCPQAAYRCALF